MKNAAKLSHRILHTLEAAKDFSNLMYFLHEEPGYDVFSRELEAAQKWVSSLVDKKGPKLSDRKRQLVELFKNCAEMTENNGYDFLAAEFQALVTISGRDAQPKSGSIEGEANAPL